MSNSNNNNNNNKNKWLTLGVVGIALLLIPRRSSLKADRKLADNAKKKVNNKTPKEDD
ncbi:hypothetical protein [Psychrobacter immobilis]|uniref:hypothetical protein n=1 Tax=Psychrobacter immobilis TaxID=498 RepID=UPI0019189B87|nr:hypothetical protein [Psychrobacter immobilis]